MNRRDLMTWPLSAMALSMLPLPAMAAGNRPARERRSVACALDGETLSLSLVRQPGRGPVVLYVHGATFPCDLSVGWRMGGLSWLDHLQAQGFDAWGLDFAGYGHSERPAVFQADPGSAPPWGDYRMGAAQIAAAIAAIGRERPHAPIHLLAHSWGTLPARQAAIEHPDAVNKLVLFGPVSTRDGSPGDEAKPAWTLISAADQRPRQRSGLPADAATPVSSQELERWCQAYLDSDEGSATRSAPSVRVANGPVADIERLWAGQALVDNARVRQPTLIVRGEWDHVTTDADVARLYAELSGAAERREVKISGGNHWLHLQPRRTALWSTTTAFLRD
ncbi:alpha/beta hydrolase [Lysobacter antibioticus]|uniref:alpha/beta hydrolase n=1 Tax=Lysobacter antibioticus TaxID=84531 RepID=UPI0004D001E4|nr:alpha/beta fold hydrolase [Lysobacter antibioticus]